MGWWKNFLRVRKQSDAVKLIVLFVLAAAGFLISAVFRGAALYRLVNAPVEYILTGGSLGGSGSSRLSEIRELADTVAVSPQQTGSSTLLYQGQEYAISYTVLSEEYVRDIYQIRKSGASRIFYMNRAAHRQFGTAKTEFQAVCISGEPEADRAGGAGQQFTVKLLLAEDILDQESPQIFVIGSEMGMGSQGFTVSGTGNGVGMSGQSTRVRVCFQRQDLDGSQLRELESLGYSLENRETLLDTEYQKNQLLLRMKYEMLIGALLIVGALALHKFGK